MKKIITIILALTIVIAAVGCSSESQQSTESTESIESERVYTGVSDTDITYGLQMMEQISWFSEEEAILKLGDPINQEGSIYSFEISTLFNKTGELDTICQDGEVKGVRWIYDFDMYDPDSRAELEQLYADIIRVLSEELCLGEPYEGDMGGSYSSYTCEYEGKTLLVDKYNDENYIELYIMLTEY